MYKNMNHYKAAFKAIKSKLESMDMNSRKKFLESCGFKFKDGQELTYKREKNQWNILELHMYKLINENGEIYESEQKGLLGGNKALKIYGKLDCSSALRWIKKGYYVKNRVFFATEEDAKKAGYRPCAVCMKEEFKAWSKTLKK